MTRKRIVNLLRKEWQVMFSSLSNTLLVTLLPLVILGQGLIYIWLIDQFGGEAILTNAIFQTALDRLKQAIPAVAALGDRQQLQVLLLNQFVFYLLLIPTMVAVSFATLSIVEEKLSGSLEALLATPVRTWELLLGKTLAGAVPAVLITWISGGAFVLGVSLLGWGHLGGVVFNAAWFLSLFLLTPAVTLLSYMLGVIGSSRAQDPKSAQNLSAAIILPVLALIAVQVTGLVWFTPLLIVGLALALGLADFVTLRIAVRLFQRESIVVKWR